MFSLQLLSNKESCAVQAHPDRPSSKSRYISNIRVSELFHVMEHENQPVTWRSGLHCFPQAANQVTKVTAGKQT